MPGRTTVLANGEFYHIFNRGSDNRNIFLQPRDYVRFKQTFYYYLFSGPKPKFSSLAKYRLTSFSPPPENKLIEIIAYCLMPNHFHFLIHQLQESGTSRFLSQLSNSYTKYFNTKYRRVGPFLQGAFKAVRVKNDEQLIHLSRYIHLNPIVSEIVESLGDYPWSSYFDYIRNDNKICAIDEILGLFPSVEHYRKFMEDQIDYGMTLEKIKNELIDIDYF